MAPRPSQASQGRGRAAAGSLRATSCSFLSPAWAQQHQPLSRAFFAHSAHLGPGGGCSPHQKHPNHHKAAKFCPALRGGSSPFRPEEKRFGAGAGTRDPTATPLDRQDNSQNHRIRELEGARLATEPPPPPPPTPQRRISLELPWPVSVRPPPEDCQGGGASYNSDCKEVF